MDSATFSVGYSYGKSLPAKYSSYAVMSKKPWPVKANNIVFDWLVFAHALASSTTALMACADSGAGIMPSERMKILAASNASTWLTAMVLIFFSLASTLMVGAMPWYLSPPAWMGAGMKSCPSVCMGTSGVSLAVSPWSKV